MFKTIGAAIAAATLAFAGSASAAVQLDTKVIENAAYADFWFHGQSHVGEALEFAPASATKIGRVRVVLHGVDNLRVNLVVRGQPGHLVYSANWLHPVLGVVGDDGLAVLSDVSGYHLAGNGFFVGAATNRRSYFDVVSISGYGIGAAVPEPSTWAMMIVGFGLAGAGLRRRRLATPA